jgi:hypothetical protein
MSEKLFLERIIIEHGNDAFKNEKAIESIKIEIDYMLAEMKLALLSADLEGYLVHLEKLKTLLPLAKKMNISIKSHQNELAKNGKYYKSLTKKIAADELIEEELQEVRQIEQEAENDLSNLLEDLEEFLVRTNIQQISLAASTLREGSDISMDMSTSLQTIDANQLEKLEQRRVDMQRQKDALAEQLEKWESKKIALVKKKGADVVTQKLDRQIAHCKHSLGMVNHIVEHPHFKNALNLVTDIKVIIGHISISDDKHVEKLSQALHITNISKLSFRDLVAGPNHNKTIVKETIAAQ